MTESSKPIAAVARKFIVSILLFSLLVTLILTSAQIYTDYFDALASIENNLEEIRITSLKSIINSMWVTDYDLLRIQLEGIISHPQIHAVTVFNDNGNIVTVGSPGVKNIISRDYPLLYSFRGRQINLGTFRVTASLDDINNQLLHKVWANLGYRGIEIFLISIFLFFLFYYLVGRHLKTMADYTEKLGMESLDKPLVLSRAGRNKDELDQLVVSINSMREGLAKEVTAHEQAEHALRTSEEKFSKAFHLSPVLMSISTMGKGRFLEVNKAFLDACGYSREEVIGRSSSELNFWVNQAGYEQMLSRLNKHNIIYNQETGLRIKSGEVLTILYSAEMIEIAGEACVLTAALDISERKKLESQLLHSQKIESIGTLAGGIAHDFNNILTTIIGYASLLENKLPSDDPLMFYVNQINTASERAANLTKGLLAFSRKQEMNQVPLDLNLLIRKIEGFLLRIIGEDIKLSTELDNTDNLTAMVDSGQLEQVLMNLAVNARDAMSHGGVLSITTGTSIIDDKFITAFGFGKPGTYAVISVSDTGYGMDAETKNKIFEPFFTTKDQGKGTGLGLSMVYGIIRQHNGYIHVYSEPGEGTTFKIYLPLIKSMVEFAETRKHETTVSLDGTEKILVAEDDPMIREIITTVLMGYGYTVITAEDGEDAVAKFIENKDDINFILLDAIMPKKYGVQAYEEIKKIRPDIKGIFLSGYAKDTIDQKSIIKEGMKFISKPISPDKLLGIIRKELDSNL